MMELTLDFLKTRPLSCSSLKQFRRSPMHYKHYLTAEPTPPSPAQVLGSMIDCLLLTESNFEDKFILKPDIDRRTKEGKKAYEEFEVAAKGKTIVTKEQGDIAFDVKAAVMENAEAMDLMCQVTQTQSRNVWDDEETTLPCLGLLDGEGDNLILELKTSHNAHPDNFIKDAFNYQYHFQAGIYYESLVAKGKKNPAVKFLVVETSAPYGVCVYDATQEFINLGRKMFKETLVEFVSCLSRGGFNDGYKKTKLDLPPWARKLL